MRDKRARDLGIKLPGTPGEYNAITDVTGVEVGFSTVIKGTPEDYTGRGSNFARTGVTAILPRGKKTSAVYAGRHNLNGNGELTGSHWIDDSGFLHGPIMITNTNSVGIVRDSLSKWLIENNFYYTFRDAENNEIDIFCQYPTVGETWDGILNDTDGFHVEEKHAMEALNSAKSGPVAEGNVGGGTGMLCHEFKGGTGTSSRVLSKEDGGYTVGALVQANHGFRDHFEILGVPMKGEIKDCDPINHAFTPKPGTGSIIVVLATDAPVLPWQLSKMCRRIQIGIGKLGAGYENCSGDIFIGFSTANEEAFSFDKSQVEVLSDEKMDPLYKAVAESVEEAILNALCAAETMEGKMGSKYYGMPYDQVVEVLKKHGKIE